MAECSVTQISVRLQPNPSLNPIQIQIQSNPIQSKSNPTKKNKTQWTYNLLLSHFLVKYDLNIKPHFHRA